MNFDQAWKRASGIKGWLGLGEAAMLWRHAELVPDDHTIVEVGAYRGRSTVLLASFGKKVVTVDPMVVGHKMGQTKITREDVIELAGNIYSRDNVFWRQEKSEDVELDGDSVGLLFIDGDHEYPQPKRDFEQFQRWLADEAFVIFHDVNMPGVWQSIRELEDEGRLEMVKGTGLLMVCKRIRS